MTTPRASKLIGVAFLLVLALQAVAQSRDEQSVRKFVKSFYEWYAPVIAKPDTDAYKFALKTKGSLFAPQLLRELREDLAAQAKVKDEIVGLDFDPFLNSQDPAPRYDVGTIRRKGAFWLAEVHAVLNGKRSAEPDVVAQVEHAGKGWRFSNFLYSRDGDLLRILRQLKRDRGG